VRASLVHLSLWAEPRPPPLASGVAARTPVELEYLSGKEIPAGLPVHRSVALLLQIPTAAEALTVGAWRLHGATHF
jgi:hypothetical protein